MVVGVAVARISPIGEESLGCDTRRNSERQEARVVTAARRRVGVLVNLSRFENG